MKARPTIARVTELLDVNPLSGVIVRKRGQGRAAAGSIVGAKDANGYLSFSIDRQHVYNHQIVYYVATGDWPDRIDHINGVRHDNRLANLRECDAGTNARNRTNWRHKKLLGAHPTASGKFAAAITADSVVYHLGVFDTEEEAHARYVLARDLVCEAERNARQAVLKELAATTPKQVELAQRIPVAE